MSELIFPSDDGILPTNLFEYKFITTIFDKDPICEGIILFNELNERYRDVSEVSRPNDDEMVPGSAFLETDIEVIFPLVLQVTPFQVVQ